ncbi:uncharacterized protein LTR77_003272 [Saxophila tyrrhenica]|uniref:Uncharacterized protein n=1 Tax=Saxophila tyrrhenica TaxID=1690608 RepID=A0AAV9PKI2_9PEZI|nr:hypothetical protein LTR77_003272 [Saxophila tyrrhenica]
MPSNPPSDNGKQSSKDTPPPSYDFGKLSVQDRRPQAEPTQSAMQAYAESYAQRKQDGQLTHIYPEDRESGPSSGSPQTPPRPSMTPPPRRGPPPSFYMHANAGIGEGESLPVPPGPYIPPVYTTQSNAPMPGDDRNSRSASEDGRADREQSRRAPPPHTQSRFEGQGRGGPTPGSSSRGGRR